MPTLPIRTDDDTAKFFRQFCSRLALTQNEGLKLLLSTQHTTAAFPIGERIRQLQDQIKDLNATVADNRRIAHAWHLQMVQHHQEYAMCIRSLLELITDHEGDGLINTPSPLDIISFKQAKASGLFPLYKYPDDPGSCIVHLNALVYGKGQNPPIFFLTKTSAGECLKMRWYPKEDYVGITPRSVYAYPDSIWYVAYRRATDGAMDLCAGIPRDAIYMPDDADDHADGRPSELSSLEAMLQHVEIRKKANL